MSTTKENKRNKQKQQINNCLKVVKTCEICSKIGRSFKSINDEIHVSDLNRSIQILELFKYMHINVTNKYWLFCSKCVKDLMNAVSFKLKCNKILAEKKPVKNCETPNILRKTKKKTCVYDKETVELQNNTKMKHDIYSFNENFDLLNDSVDTEDIPPILLSDIDDSSLNESLKTFEEVLDFLENESLIEKETSTILPTPQLLENNNNTILQDISNKQDFQEDFIFDTVFSSNKFDFDENFNVTTPLTYENGTETFSSDDGSTNVVSNDEKLQEPTNIVDFLENFDAFISETNLKFDENLLNDLIDEIQEDNVSNDSFEPLKPMEADSSSNDLLSSSVFDSLFEYYSALKLEKEEKIPSKHSCMICKIKFTKVQDLVLHLQVHKNYNYVCNICSEQFLDKFFIKNHNCNNNNFVFSCLKCKRSCKSMNIMSHSCPRKKPEKGKTAKLVKKLEKKGKENVKGDKKYKCHLCKCSFWSREKLHKHVTRTHKAKGFRYLCHICSSSFMIRRVFIKHMKEAH